MIADVADTHTALWYLLKNPRLSMTAREFIDAAARAGHEIVVSPISLAEIVYLVEKGRLDASAYHDLKKALADPAYVIGEAPFTSEVIECMRQVPRAGNARSHHSGDGRLFRRPGYQSRQPHPVVQDSNCLVIRSSARAKRRRGRKNSISTPGGASIGFVEEQEIYAAIGEAGFRQFVGGFYGRVAEDEILSRLYPKGDLAGAEERLREFLIFRFGGPERYIERRGHPRLRMRHAPFPVDQAARDRWMQLMQSSLEETAFPQEVKDLLLAYFDATATAMINRG